MKPKQPPAGWGDDTLTEYLELAHRNRLATFAIKKDALSKLIGIDDCFMRASGHNSRPAELIAGMLLVRCHSSFRAACEHAMAGQVAECFNDIRACLENSAYALRIGSDLAIAEIWIRRHDSPESDAEMRKTFQAKQLKAAIASKNRKAAEVYETLYQRAIDFGAHPNERAMSSSLSIRETLETQEYEQLQLHGDGLHLGHALKSTAQAGVCALEILQGVFSARFEILGINADILSLRSGL